MATTTDKRLADRVAALEREVYIKRAESRYFDDGSWFEIVFLVLIVIGVIGFAVWHR